MSFECRLYGIRQGKSFKCFYTEIHLICPSDQMIVDCYLNLWRNTDAYLVNSLDGEDEGKETRWVRMFTKC